MAEVVRRSNAKASTELLDALDHPVTFTFLIALTTVAWCALIAWGFKAAHMPGPAGLFQHP